MIAGFCRATVEDGGGSWCLTGEISRDFTGDTFVLTVSLCLDFRAASAACFCLAATHLSQSGLSQRRCFFVLFAEAVLPDLWECVSPSSVGGRRCLLTLTSSCRAPACSSAFAGLVLAEESALADVACVRLEYPESEATSEEALVDGTLSPPGPPPGGPPTAPPVTRAPDERFAATLATLRLPWTSSRSTSS